MFEALEFVKTIHEKDYKVENHHYCVLINYNPPFYVYGKNNNIPFKSISTKHSEMDLISKLYKYNYNNLPKKIDLLLIKISKTGSVTNSKPCKCCIEFLKKFNEKSKSKINKIYYSVDSNNIICENFKSIKSNHKTYGLRKKI